MAREMGISLESVGAGINVLKTPVRAAYTTPTIALPNPKVTADGIAAQKLTVET